MTIQDHINAIGIEATACVGSGEAVDTTGIEAFAKAALQEAGRNGMKPIDIVNRLQQRLLRDRLWLRNHLKRANLGGKHVAETVDCMLDHARSLNVEHFGTMYTEAGVSTN